MNDIFLAKFNELIKNLNLTISDYKNSESDSRICSFNLNNHKILMTFARKTPNKIGFFVSLWKRDSNGKCIPYSEKDDFDFLLINVCDDQKLGQFIFDKSILIKKNIISSKMYNGRNGTRVYSSWDIVNNVSAQKTQEWQKKYFFDLLNDVYKFPEK